MSPLQNIIVVGAGGKLGPHILHAFSSDPLFHVSVLTRAGSTSKFPSHIKVHTVGDDYPHADLLNAFKGQHVVVSTIATASADAQKKLIDAAIEAGVKRFVPSEFGCDVRNEKGFAIIPQFFRGKVDTVEYLRSKEREGLTWTTFVTGSFFELAVNVGYMGFDLPNRKATYINNGQGKWSTTTFPTVGLAVKNAMIKADETVNKIIYVNSFTVSQRDVVASLEKATHSVWKTSRVDGEEQKKTGLEKIGRGDFSGAPLLLSYINVVEGHGADYAGYKELDNEMLGLPREELDVVVKEIVDGTR